MKYGVSPDPTFLEWHVSSQPQWGTPFIAGQWYNFAYDIDVSPTPARSVWGYDNIDRAYYLLSSPGTPWASGRRTARTRS